jgi:hypothetical protein
MSFARTFRSLILLLLAVMAAWARADGTFAKLGATVDGAAPGIPYQRAIVAYRDGVETMVVESTLNGPAGDYAWIVPLPSPPTRVTAVSPDAFSTSAWRVRPAVAFTRGFGMIYFWQLAGICLGLVGLCIALFGFGKQNPRRTGHWVIAATVLWMLVSTIFFPVFAGRPASIIDPISRHLAGNYEVEVLKTQDEGALTQWLRPRGGQLNPRARQTVAAYGREGWCFAVAQLRPHKGGQATPHPLAFEFRTPRPIYPMRLTGTQTNALILDLFVVANGSAELPPLRTWVSRKAYEAGQSDRVDRALLAQAPLAALAWKGATITRLRGELRPEQMGRDFEIRTKPFEARKIRVTTDELLADERRALALWWGGLALFVVASGTAFAGFAFDRRIAWSVLSSVAIGMGAYLIDSPTVERIEPNVYLVAQ